MVNEIKNRQRDKTAAVCPTADTVSHSGIYKSIWEILDANIIGKAFASFTISYYLDWCQRLSKNNQKNFLEVKNFKELFWKKYNGYLVHFVCD